jgi:hypothetical protein
MKKIFYLLLFANMMMLVDSCEKDNFPKPNAQFFGAIKDSLGGALIETEITTGNTIGVTQEGLATPVTQTWYIQKSGEFTNNLVFSNTYDITLANVNFFPYNVNGLVIKPGPNEHDFIVVPYIRIKNCTITNNSAIDSTITASFTLEAGRSVVRVSRVTLFAYSNMFVGNYSKFTITTGTGTPTKTYSPVAIINPATNIILTIDLKANRALFKHGNDYYFRVGSLASLTGVGTVRYNFIPYVKITL